MDHTNHEKTPKRILGNLGGYKNPISTPKNFARKFLLLSNNKSTPSPNSLKNRVVRNPFEHQVHDHLRLPVISSPSLFQPPRTPKQEENKLEVFEWTIEELSNLNPVNVVPHETQFQENDIDPQYEEKAQAAISSFFQEQQIVPSPHSCVLRKQKIQLYDEHSTKIYNSTALINNTNNVIINNTSAMISAPSSSSPSSSTKTKRDITTQTALSFPPNLPREIEDLLKKYQINDESTDHEVEQIDNDRSMMDISTLRRKLFIQRPETPENEFPDDTFAANLSPAPKTPELTRCSYSSQNNNGDAFEAIKGDMFGEISPICNNDFSNNCSPVMSSNDISMTSDAGRDYTPASRRCNGKLKKKRLSQSFSLLQNDFDNDSDDNKENFHKDELPVNKDRRLFGRFDSGFENGDSNHNYSFSAEFMQI